MRRTWAAAMTAATVVALAAPRAVPAQEPPAARPSTDPVLDAANTAAGDPNIGIEVSDLRDTLLGDASSREDRDEAARRLVARQSDEARSVLRQVVTQPGVNADARLAALRALAIETNPSTALLENLLPLLGGNEDRLVDAAADALAAYKREPRVLEALRAVVQDGKRRVQHRISAARALGRIPEQPAAAALVGIVTNPGEQPDLVAAAAAALVEMTGLDANGRDPAKWDQWLKQTGNLPPAEWARAVLPSRAARDERLHRRADEATSELGRLLRQQYQETPDEGKPRMLLRYLNNPSAEIRRVGTGIAQQVSALPAAAKEITEAVESRVLELAGDTDVGVRLDATRTLVNLPVDPDRLLATLLPQLRVETDSNVRQAIAQTLTRALVDRPAQFTRVLDELAALLDDASPAVVKEAAESIEDIAARGRPLLQKDPAAGRRTAERLRAAITRLADRPGFQEARRACGEALAVFRDEQSQAFARELLNPRRREPAAVRGVALAILGELGPRGAGDITSAVDNESDRNVRVEGVRALARTGSFEQSDWLAQRMNDREPAVREAAADTYRKLLPTATPEKLANEADRRKNNPSLRVDILRALVDKLRAAGQREQAALQEQNIGAEYLRSLKRPDLAVPYLRSALDQLRDIGYGQGATDKLRQQLIDAMLQSRQYAQLAALGQEWIQLAPDEQAANIYRRDIGVSMRNEAERLLEAYRRQAGADARDNLDHASALIDAALKMQPPLDDLVRRNFTDLRRDTDELLQRAARTAPPR